MGTEQLSQALGPQQARVYLAIRSAIESGRLQPGQPLGAQAQLAREHGVALATLHQALRALQEAGYLEIRHGVGTFVAAAPPVPRDPLRALARFAAQSFASATEAAEAALALLAEYVGVRSAFLSRFAGDELVIVADYDHGGCGIRAGASFPLKDAF